ncbi:hypothetical protein GVN20_08150 [Runella sp. CRIBMP]|uniref:hypothetical protein n=1 Tax=Runella sp. CRIBMP TaxID=2683261 RepID=UPI00141213A4|nr:hypothetical protein [Runella sp. CRIBMP]NBB19320.1 hypothetical protein [Runella sp. CRIBMP]
MKNYLYILFIFFSYVGYSQRLFDNPDLYQILRTGDQKLQEGKFDEARGIYASYKVLMSGATNDYFENQIKKCNQLKNLYQQAEKNFKAKGFLQALSQYREYRKLMPNSDRIAAFEDRIQLCLIQIDKGLVGQVRDLERIVTGFEWSDKGQRQIIQMDTSGAQFSFQKAKKWGSTLNTTLQKQYEEGITAVRDLKAWGKKVREAKAKGITEEEEISLLKEGEKISIFKIQPLREKIESMEVSTTFPINQSPLVIIQSLAKACKIDQLASYIKLNKDKIENSDKLLESIKEFQNTQNEISKLNPKLDRSKETLLISAYENLLKNAANTPLVGNTLLDCAKQEYVSALVELAGFAEKSFDDSGEKGQVERALTYLAKAQNLVAPQKLNEVEEAKSRVVGKLGCDSVIRDFRKSVTDVRRALNNCRLQEAKAKWDEASIKLNVCSDAASGILNNYASLTDSILSLTKNDSLYSELQSQIRDLVQRERCDEAQNSYDRLKDLKICDDAKRSRDNKTLLESIQACKSRICYKETLVRAEKAESTKEWKKAYRLYEESLKCAAPGQIEVVNAKLSELECEAFPERCKSETTYFRPEVIGAYSLIKPNYRVGNKTQEMSIWHLISGGLQLSLISHSSPVDFSVGAEYFETQFQSLGTIKETKYVLEDFALKGVNGFATMKLHKAITDPNRWRPYVKLGIEGMIPLSYRYVHYTSGKIIDDKEQLNAQSFSGIGGIGIELQRKRFGCFLELFGSYNFTGIYNANATNPSATLNSSISANIHRAGVRLGVRVW